MSARELITDHLDLWTGAVTSRSTAGRGRNGKVDLTGIKKLRELILELAVRGKLVEQNPSDEPASVLLEKIAEDKDRLVKEGRIRKPKNLPKVEEEEKPFKLPEGWSWARLGNISQINPRNDADDETLASFIPMPMISTSCHGEHEQETRSWGAIKKSYTHFADGDIAIAKITPCFENSKAAVFRNLENAIGAGTTELHVARPYGENLNPLFILLCLKSPRFLSAGEKKMTGSAGQKRVPKYFFSGEPLPLPPLAEQYRIVEKVDELMALCDRLEQQVGDQLEAYEVLVDTLLDALTRSADASEVAENWARIAEHFDTLFTTEASIDKLKQTILQLAVMGRLVSQDPSDEPASVLLEKIAEEKARLIKEGKIKKLKKFPFPSDQDKIFSLPDGWEWASIASTGVTSTGKTPSTKEKHFFDGDIPFIGPGQINKEGEVSEPEKFLSELGLVESEEAMPNDLLVVCIGGSIGKCAKTHMRCGFNQQINKVRPILVHPDYLLSTLSTELVRNLVLEKSTGSATPIINRSKWEAICIPLPPINEQHRIVEKVDELMTLCDQLKARLGEAGETRAHLAGAVVDQAV